MKKIILAVLLWSNVAYCSTLLTSVPFEINDVVLRNAPYTVWAGFGGATVFNAESSVKVHFSDDLKTLLNNSSNDTIYHTFIVIYNEAPFVRIQSPVLESSFWNENYSFERIEFRLNSFNVSNNRLSAQYSWDLYGTVVPEVNSLYILSMGLLFLRRKAS